MLNEYFKQTMDRFGVEGTKLSKHFGCGRGYISDIRTGKCNPPSARLWELVISLDELAPGAKHYFGNLIAENYERVSPEDLAVSIEPEELVALMSNEQLSKLMLAIANRIGDMDKKLKKDDQLLLVS